nr:preprotein translocase subunit SecA [Sciadococcus taiwanensis]
MNYQKVTNPKLLQLLLYSNGYLTKHLELILQEPLALQVVQTSLKNLNKNYDIANGLFNTNIASNYIIQREIYLQTKAHKKLVYAISWWTSENFIYYYSNPNISLGYNLLRSYKKLKKKIQYINPNWLLEPTKFVYNNCGNLRRNCLLWQANHAAAILQEFFLPYLLELITIRKYKTKYIALFMNFLKSLFANSDQRKIQNYEQIVTKINNLEYKTQTLRDQELLYKTVEFKQRLEEGEKLDSLLIEAFAVVKEAAWRTVSLKPFDVQLIGGIILHKGMISEMKTGEGKTLVASLPAYLNALNGKGVHIVTVNDYLARRDAEFIGQIFRFLGLEVGLIQQNMSQESRKKNYACDITYVTNSELGFDYLRDNMATSLGEIVQKPFHYCIIDEVDSILIDEARTPLIISGPAEISTERYFKAAKLSSFLKKDSHYEIDEKAKNIILSENGITVCEQALNVNDLYDPENPWAHYIYNALKAKEFFLTNIHYIIKSQEIVIVDEFTGRIMPGRRWSDGLHQAIEAKENVNIQKETQTLASITYQNLFLLYPKLSGMTGTAKTEENEFDRIYKLEVLPIPTNMPMIRKDLPDLVYRSEYEKWKAIANECIDMYNLGRPILVGTTSVEKSELLANLLTEYKIPYNLLNAKPENVEREAEIIAQAGRKHAITIATNMAGRGTDIILGGNLNYMLKDKISKLIDLSYTKSEINFEIELKKEISQFSSEAQIKIREFLQYFQKFQERNSLSSEEIVEKLNTNLQTGNNQDDYNLILIDFYYFVKTLYKSFFEKEHQEVVDLGGLHVIGTERHESRRIDNQLRGRSGRQGDPGSSRFFLSLEDNLLRIFGGERIYNLMNTLQVEEDVPIESQLLSRSLDSAQKKVENYYYDARKQLFEYDEVLNSQRQAIYSERRRIINTSNLRDWILSYAKTVIDDVLDTNYTDSLNIQNNTKSLIKIQNLLGLPSYLFIKDYTDMNLENLKKLLYEQLCVSYDLKEAQIEQIEVGLMRQLERSYLLQQIDTNWTEHLQQMGFLRESIGWRGYGQKDPLIEYKNEGYDLFISMVTSIRHNVMYLVFRSKPIIKENMS